MAFAQPWLLVLCITGLLMVLGVASGLVNARLWVSEPLACVVVGILLGPVGFGLLRLDVGSDPDAMAFLREAARATLAVSVTAAGMRLSRGWLGRNWRGLAVALGPGMLAMWLVGSATASLLGLPWATCLLLGAVLTPTDPVLSAPIVTGRLARIAVPSGLRDGITAESGANDGLAAPLISLSLALVLPDRSLHGLGWAATVVLWETGSAIAAGAVVGWIAGQALNWAEQRRDADPAPLLTIALSLAGVMLASMQLLGGNGILAAFVAGAVLNEAVGGKHEERQEHFNEGFSRFFDLPVLVLFGAAAPWAAWASLGWLSLVFPIALLAIRRLPIWLALSPHMGWTRTRPEALFAGWFGPIGAAAVFYACDIQIRTGLSIVWTATSLVVLASVMIYGITGTPLTHRLGQAMRDLGC